MAVDPAIQQGVGGVQGNTLASNPLTGTNVSTAGVTGESNTGPGVLGSSRGLVPTTLHSAAGVDQPAGDGVLGIGKNGVHGQSADAGGNAVWGEHSGGGNGVYGTSKTGNAGLFDGKVVITGSAQVNGDHTVSGAVKVAGAAQVGGDQTVGGTIKITGDAQVGGDQTVGGAIKITGSAQVGGDQTVTGTMKVSGSAQVTGDHTVGGTINVGKDVVLTGADCAEEFDIDSSAAIEAGIVMVMVEGGALQPSTTAYDRKVAGVIAGAGEYRPGLILGRKTSAVGRLPIALIGKVYCKVDADHGAIEVGDLLTTSTTPGHAMKASDRSLAFGAVLGKALQSLKSGKGMIPILVALQ